MSTYFDRVEAQLVQRADALYPASAVGSPVDERRVRPTGALAGGVLGAAGGLVAALIMLLGASPATPDFSVSRGKGRSVTISAATPSSIAALNNRLASLGIAVRVARVRPDCAAPIPRIAPRSAHRRALVAQRLRGDHGALLRVRVTPPSRPGQTLVVASAGPGAEPVGELITGSPPACIRGARRDHALLGALS